MARTSTARANALRQARAAKAAREAARLAREARIEATLTDFFEANARAQKVRADAARRAQGIVRDAEAKAAADDRTAGVALRELRELVGSHTEVAELCGLGVGTVRHMIVAEATTDVRRPTVPPSASGESTTSGQPALPPTAVDAAHTPQTPGGEALPGEA